MKLRRTVGLIVGYLMIFGGIAVALPAAFFVLLGVLLGGISSQLVPFAGGLALIALGFLEVYLTDDLRPAER